MTTSHDRRESGSLLTSVLPVAVPLVTLLFGLPASMAHAVEPSYSILHSFQSAESNPKAPLISDGRGNLYGTTAHGGPSDGGTVFTIKTDGTGFQRLHTFTGGVNDGFDPEASLVLDDVGRLYGTTLTGGASNGGTIFTIKEDGSGFAVLHSFAGGANDGSFPSASPTLDGAGSLYGTTLGGGPSNYGTVFRLGTDGTGFQVLHAFLGGAGDGRGPASPLVVDDSGTLFGTTTYGGLPAVHYLHYFYDGSGTIFRIEKDGTGFHLLRALPVSANDGEYPSGSLTMDESGSLYGLTGGGGSSAEGTAFRISKNGSGFKILHSFTGGSGNGLYPVASLVPDRSGNLYGMTSGGGIGIQATIFRITTDATGFEVLRSFHDSVEGTSPSGLLVLNDSGALYGTMAYGGSSSSGTVFSVNTDGNVFQVRHTFAGFINDGSQPEASLIADGSGYLYGTTTFGGSSAEGTVFRVKSDGTGFQLLHTFAVSTDGATPWCAGVLDRFGNLYGTTPNGGPLSGGTIFRLGIDGSGFQVLHIFQGGAADGVLPAAPLILDGSGNLYGTTTRGGASEAGTVFRMRTDGSGFQLLHAFAYGSATDGAEPTSLLLDGVGDLYGMTTQGGASDFGTVFKLRADGTGFQLLHSFGGGPNDGSNPQGSLAADISGSLFGTTLGGGASGAGIIFSVKTDGTNFRVLHSFTRTSEGGSGIVILDGLGHLYGTTQYGGPFEAGTVFRIRTDGADLQILHAFGDGSDDGKYPRCSLLLDGLGNLYGTTQSGGPANLGTIFTLWPNRHRPAVTPGPFVPVGRH